MAQFKNLFLFSFLLIFLFSCAENLADKRAKGGKKYGGEVSFVETEIVSSFFPLYSHGLHDQRMHSNLFEPLLKVDPKTKKIVPNLARKFTIKEDGRTVEIVIRKDIYFHPDNYNGKKLKNMTIEDVKFSLEFACSGNKLNQLGHVLTKKIVGSEWFQIHSKTTFPKRGVSGILIKNDSTISISLTNSFNNFTSLLCHPSIVVFSKEAYNYYHEKSLNHPIGTGPFMLSTANKNQVVLIRNSNYWRFDNYGNQLPFLGKIRVFSPNSAKNEQLLFSKGKTDILLHLPINRLDYAFGTLKEAKNGRNLLHRILYRKGIKVNYLAFDCATKPFKDERVRRAFYQAIDREKIWLNVLNGDGNISSKGFVPRSDFYSDEKVTPIVFNPKKAEQLLADAGYSQNNPFPDLELYISSQKGSLMSLYYEELVKQVCQNLGVKLKLKYVNYLARNKLIEQCKIKIWKAGWVSDYPDPESYLGVFYSGYKGPNNYIWNLNKFKNASFDSLFYQSILTKNSREKLLLQNQCDQILVNQAAVVPLYTEDIFIVVNIRARDIAVSSSGIIDFSEVYVKKL